MHQALKSLRDYSDNAGEYIGKHFDKSSDIPEQLVRAYHKYYPEIKGQVRNGRNKFVTPAKNAYAPYRKQAHGFANEANSFACSLRKNFHRTELGLLIAGAGFLLHELFHAEDQGLPSPVEKVKAQIEAKPVQSAIVALGIGFAVSTILF